MKLPEGVSADDGNTIFNQGFFAGLMCGFLVGVFIFGMVFA